MQVFTFVQGILSLLQAFISPLYSSTYPFCQSIQINEEKNKTTTTNKKSANQYAAKYRGTQRRFPRKCIENTKAIQITFTSLEKHFKQCYKFVSVQSS